MEPTVGLAIVLVPVALITFLGWGAWRVAQPVQLHKQVQEKLESVLGAHSTLVMHNRELNTALRAERAQFQQLQRQLALRQHG